MSNNKFLDVTKEWLDKATPNSHIILNSTFYKDINGVIYNVDGTNVILDYSIEEKKMAIWLENTFGGKIYMNPKVNIPKGIKTADYIWNGERWDLKSLSDNAISKSRAVDNLLKNGKYQANNIILNITKTKLSKMNIIIQIKNIYNDPKRIWIDKIIIVKNYKLIKIYKRK